MNTDQFYSIVRSVLKLVGGYLIAHSGLSVESANMWAGVVIMLAGFWWSHQTHSTEPAPAQGNLFSVLLCLIVFSCLVTGCGTVYNSSKITKHTDSFFGVRVVTSSASTQTPEIDLGFARSVTEIIPTSTNGVVNAPKSMTAFNLKQSVNPFATGIEENSGTGDVYVGGTNDTSKAIVPSAYVPPVATPKQ